MPQGGLFTEYFLGEGITETASWQALAREQVEEFCSAARSVFAAFPYTTEPNEAQTEDDLIWKILALLGWDSFLRQQNLSAKGKADVPDGLLFPDDEAKARANTRAAEYQRYEDGVCVVESKRWARKLDRKDALSGDGDVPSTQILRYLRRVDDVTQGRVRWGILTNGRHWRLYFQGAMSVSEEFLELDLPVLLGLDGFNPDLFDGEPEHNIRVFMLMFGRDAFLPTDDGRTFHTASLDEGRRWEQRVADDLSHVVFAQVFPGLVKGLVAADPACPTPISRAYLDEVRDAALILLYRLLFVLYAEDRNLLPVRDSRYDDYGMRIKVRTDIARRMDQEDIFAETIGPYYQHMQNLFRIISEGEASLGLPPYNGGLFHGGRVAVLERIVLPDRVFAPVVDALSRTTVDGQKQWINYRDLTVRQLGSIYEQLLEHEVVQEPGGDIAIRPNVFARKGSGSYYTPDDLVRLIIQRTLGPLLDGQRQAFEHMAGIPGSGEGKGEGRLEQLLGLDPATGFLDIKVCDPAMGSGHFLVDLVDFMADQILEAMAWAKQVVDGADYESPLVATIAAIRNRILEQASDHGWANVNEDHLDDRQIVRRMILKRVIYGVDKNPMAVELAKVALWLHTFTVGAPLSFLDHHLRVGDSLFGEFVRPVEDVLVKRGGLYLRPSVKQGMDAAKGMMAVEHMTDADIAEVQTSASTFDGVSNATAPLMAFLGLFHAFQWLAATDKEAGKAFDAFLDGIYGDPMEIAAGAAPTGKKRKAQAFQKQLDTARALDREQGFLHWEAAFPGVWTDWESTAPQGGFDAIVGNPPWDRIKLQQVEWFAARKPDIAHAQRAADRKAMIETLRKKKDPLYDDFVRARDLAESASAIARSCGQYPLLSGGDINLYSLFVERSRRLIKPTGILGLLVPSGIASDKGPSVFFKGISTGGHLAALLDFENRKVFFPEVDSRFKFCVFIVGGTKRTFDLADCGFFLRHVDDIDGASFPLGPKDFAAVNPNTGTAPIFRTKRDAELTRAIYGRVPVLVDHRTDPEIRVFPIKYSTMFHMANDSDKFRTIRELEADGAYKVAGSLWKKGDVEYVPLYEGKMVQAYDHRASNIIVVGSNLFRPGQTETTSIEDHTDPEFSAIPRYFIEAGTYEWLNGLEWTIAFKDITASTNVRTMIATLIPNVGAGHTLPVLYPRNSDKEAIEEYRDFAPTLVANFNSLIFDYVARQKVQSTHLTWYILEQLPVLPEELYNKMIGTKSARDIVREEVLELTYTAHDMEPFARDMGYDGPPFVWDEDERRHLRARLDALYFILYGIGRDDADYILSTFPIVRKQDEDQFGFYLTRDLILGYMAAFAAGDTDSQIAI